MFNKLSLLLIILSQVVLGQNQEITGSITLENELVLGAEIIIKELNKATTSNENGKFILTDIPKGTYVIEVSYIGTETVLKKIMLNDQPISISIKLISNSSLDEVIVSVPGSKLQKDLVVNVEKKKLSEINKETSSTLAESIANINGISQNSTGSSIGKPVIRGLTSNRVVTFAQGTRVENQQWGAEHGLGVSSNGIKSVEVIKGPASLLYGSDAIGGVLYFVDEDFTKQKIKGVVETTYFNNAENIQTRAGVKLGFGDFKINTFLGQNSAGDYKISKNANFNADRVFNTRFDERNAKISLGLLKENYQSKLTYSYLNNFFGIPVPSDNPIFTDDLNRNLDLLAPIDGPLQNFVLPFQDVTQHIISSENKFNIKESDALLTLGYSINDRQEFNDVETTPDLHLYLQVFNYNLKISDLIKTDKFDLTAGAQGLFQDTENRGNVFLIPDGKSAENGLYGLLNYKVHSNLRFQAGLRFDSKRLEAEGIVIDENTSFSAFDETYNTLNYSIGAKYDVNDFSFRFNIASGYRAPNASELLSNGEHGGTGQIERGDPTLESESATQFDFALNYKNTEGLNITINPFVNIIDNYIFLSPTGVVDPNLRLPIFEYLQENALLFGGELNLNYVPNFAPKLIVQTGAALTYGNDSDGNPLPFIPPVNFNTKISYNINLGKQLKLDSLYFQQQNFIAQNRVANGELKNNDYHLVDLGLNASYKSFNFSASVKNVFDIVYTDHLSRLKTSFAESNIVVPNPGRDIVFNLNYNF